MTYTYRYTDSTHLCVNRIDENGNTVVFMLGDNSDTAYLKWLETEPEIENHTT